MEDEQLKVPGGRGIVEETLLEETDYVRDPLVEERSFKEGLAMGICLG